MVLISEVEGCRELAQHGNLPGLSRGEHGPAGVIHSVMDVPFRLA
jgi:hypothetical protein